MVSQQNQFKMLSLKVIELAFLILTLCVLLSLCSLDHKALNLAYDVVRELWWCCSRVDDVIEVKSHCTVGCNRGKGSPLLAGWVTHHLINIPQQITPAPCKTCAKPVQNPCKTINPVRSKYKTTLGNQFKCCALRKHCHFKLEPAKVYVMVHC